MDYVDFVSETLYEAGAIATAHFGKVSTVETKPGDNNQVLTEADVAIGRLIIEKIRGVFPGYNIIDEEAGVIDNAGEFTWVVDPIDGTSNFANGLRTYGIMIGLLQEHRAIVGGILLPGFDELYVAQEGRGAFCNGQPIRVSTEKSARSCLVAYGIDGHPEDEARTRGETALLADIILNIRNLRTTNSAYDMVQVPAGRYGAYLNRTTKIWDNVALDPIVREAGGIVTDFWGDSLDYSNPLTRAGENYTICAGAPEIHAQLQRVIHAHGRHD